MRSLVTFHVVANLIWIGAILAVGLLLTKGPGDAKQRGEAARLVYRVLAVPGMGLSFALGATLLGLEPTLYFKVTHHMHAKLPLVLVVIGLHHVLGARARKMMTGEAADAGPAGALTAVLGVCAVAAAVIVMLKPF